MDVLFCRVVDDNTEEEEEEEVSDDEEEASDTLRVSLANVISEEDVPLSNES